MSPELIANHAEHEVQIEHHFVGAHYIKQARFPAGKVLAQHVHKFAHPALLLEGSVQLEAGGIISRHDAPAAIVIPAHLEHKVTSITPVLWWCVWPTDLTGPDEIDRSVTA